MSATLARLFGNALAALLVAAAPAAAQDRVSLQQKVERKLSEGPAGARFGLVVATLDGRELIAINPDARFIPASNTKVVTTAAAYANLPALNLADSGGGAAVYLQAARDSRHPDVVIEGNGDARLSSAADCVSNCLAELATAIAARARRVDDVIGDDRRFPDQRWSQGMSWNNLWTRSGTAVSALSLDGNELQMRVFPTAPGQPPRTELLPYFTVVNRAVTIAEGKTDLQFERMPGSSVVQLTGTILAAAEPEKLQLGIDDPAHYSAWMLKRMLEERGVRVGGSVEVRHRPWSPADDPKLRAGAAPLRTLPTRTPLARLAPPPLTEDIAIINKVSQNVHAELLLRRIGYHRGSGSVADGIAGVRAMLDMAAVTPAEIEVHDGSGMSTYNRIAPRGMVKLLSWITRQPWGAEWRASLPIGGRDGTLAKRFAGTPLHGRLFAKTGTLNASNALAGYMITRSGATLLFAAYANDVPSEQSALPTMDGALVMIAAEN